MNDLLAADVGNSTTKVALFRGARLRLHLAFDTGRATPSAIYSRLNRSLREQGQGPPPVRELAVCTVVRRATATWRQVARLLGARLFVVRGDTPTPLKNEYRDPAALGPDRLAAAVGGAGACGTPVIVVNLGTATTIDAVSAEGRFLGGAICLGLGSALDALAGATSLLPAIPASRARTAIGKDTRRSILAGSYYGAIGQVNEIIARQRAVVGGNAPVAATGGFSRLVARRIEGRVLVRPNLTLDGIRLIWLHNHESGQHSQ